MLVCIYLFITLGKHFLTVKAMQEHALFLNFYCVGTSSSPLPSKRPVDRPKKKNSLVKESRNQI